MTDCIQKNILNSDKEFTRISAWFNTLSVNEKLFIKRIVTDTARSVAFGFFCVLDGVRAIEDGQEKGSLELKCVYESQEILLTNPDSDFLHDLFNDL